MLIDFLAQFEASLTFKCFEKQTITGHIFATPNGILKKTSTAGCFGNNPGKPEGEPVVIGKNRADSWRLAFFQGGLEGK